MACARDLSGDYSLTASFRMDNLLSRTLSLSQCLKIIFCITVFRGTAVARGRPSNVWSCDSVAISHYVAMWSDDQRLQGVELL